MISEQPNINEYDDWIVRAVHKSSVRISKAKQFDCLRSLFNTLYIIAKRQTLNIAKENKSINLFLFLVILAPSNHYRIHSFLILNELIWKEIP
jgi:hypothetical protein